MYTNTAIHEYTSNIKNLDNIISTHIKYESNHSQQMAKDTKCYFNISIEEGLAFLMKQFTHIFFENKFNKYLIYN